MKRRDLLLGLSATSLSGCGVFGGAPAQLDFSLPRPTRVRIDTRKRGAALDDGMLGLSFDNSALAQPRLLSADNPQLLGLLRGLGQHGVIRLGGHSTSSGQWQPNGKPQAPYRYAITHDAIDRLARLVDRSGWSLIYSLNLAHGDPARTADEAAYVSRRIGKRVLAFELGNAPDRYVQDHLRPSGYDVNAAIVEWKRYAAAVRAQLPNAPLAGPATADITRPEWTEAFIKACANDLQLITVQADGHEARQLQRRYGYGSLAGHVFELSDKQQAGLDRIATAARQAQRPCRITQARAVEQRHSMDTLGAALWALDLFYQRCGALTAPWAGICFHDVLQLNADTAGLPLRSGPLYYALRMLALTLPAQPVGSSVVPPPIPGAKPGGKPAPTVLRSHALLDRHQRLQLVLINPDANRSVDVRVDADIPLRNGNVLRLSGAALNAASGVTLASGTADAQGDWRPLYTDTAQIDHGYAYLTVGAGSAVLVLFD